ncbi:unnamed protein product [Enterobius vermicularis]|uniref:PRA1 family protein n=1 Tax=Enterobius vermicularis TaxID=51028 RepID=A0A0N4UWM4_ENTVE|nr:unnamed protein product [Enterobius vermicularis]
MKLHKHINAVFQFPHPIPIVVLGLLPPFGDGEKWKNLLDANFKLYALQYSLILAAGFSISLIIYPAELAYAVRAVALFVALFIGSALLSANYEWKRNLGKEETGALNNKKIKNFMEVAVTVALLIAAIILFWILLLNYITLAMPSISLIIVLVHASVHGVALNGGKKERSVVFDAIYYIAELEISKIVKARGKYILLIFFQRR